MRTSSHASTRPWRDGTGPVSGRSAALLLLLASAIGQAAHGDVDRAFVPASRVDPASRPTFPRSAVHRREEGWVVLSYVVDVDGRVSEVVLEDSSGIASFERAAVGWVEDLRFRPATIDGEPVAQAFNRHGLTFDLEGFGDGVSRPVRAIYRDRRDALAAGDLDAVAEALARADDRDGLNLYETAWIAVLRGLYCRERGDAECSRDAFDAALTFGRRTVEAKMLRTTADLLLQEQLDAARFRAALRTAAIRDDIAGERAPHIEALRTRLEALEAGETPFDVAGVLRSRGADARGRGIWGFRPLRRMPALVAVDGRLDTLEIRCEAHQSRIVPEPGRAWRIPAEWGDCTLYWFGDPGTRLLLREYAASARFD
jgi:TonB family protein